MKDLPFISFGNGELKGNVNLEIGDTIVCPHCAKLHEVSGGVDTKTGEKSDMLLFYKCGKNAFLTGICGKKI